MMKWIRAAMHDEPITVYGGKDKELAPLHVDDFVDFITTVIDNFDENPNETFSVAGKIMTAEEIVTKIKKVTGSKSDVMYYRPEHSQPQKCNRADIEIHSDLEEKIKKEVSNLQHHGF